MRARSAAATRGTERALNVESALDIDRRAPPTQEEREGEVDRSSRRTGYGSWKSRSRNECLFAAVGGWARNMIMAQRVLSDYPRHLGARANERRGADARGDAPLERRGIACARIEQKVPRRRIALHVRETELLQGSSKGLHWHVGDGPKERHVARSAHGPRSSSSQAASKKRSSEDPRVASAVPSPADGRRRRNCPEVSPTRRLKIRRK
jgi:hypothetical protein